MDLSQLIIAQACVVFNHDNGHIGVSIINLYQYYTFFSKIEIYQLCMLLTVIYLLCAT